MCGTRILIDYITGHISVVSYLYSNSNGIFEEFQNLKNDKTFFFTKMIAMKMTARLSSFRRLDTLQLLDEFAPPLDVGLMQRVGG